jgi:hypothetical protein
VSEGGREEETYNSQCDFLLQGGEGVIDSVDLFVVVERLCRRQEVLIEFIFQRLRNQLLT